MVEEQKTTTIDQNLYSRQLGTFGMEAMGKLIKMKVLIHGLRGVGIETAKNLILAGPNTVILHDNGLVELRDLASNFYLQEQDAGIKTRSEASLTQLKDLNPYVNVDTYKGEINGEYIKQFDVVVFTDYYDIDRLIEYNEICHSQAKPIGFILAGSLGLYGYTFVDFGDSFRVFDRTGEEVRSTIVVNVTKEENGIVTVHEDKKHRFTTGDHVTFSEVQGMEELNGKTFEIKVVSPYSFAIGDTRGFSDYKREGVAIQVRMPEEIKFRKLEASLLTPIPQGKHELDTADYTKCPDQLHVTLTGLFHYFKKHHNLPSLNNEKDADELVAIVKELNEKNQKIMDIEGLVKLATVDEKLVKNVAYFARAQISPCASFWGGVVAQEVVKFTGKFGPLHQWLHYDCFESLPEGNVNREVSKTRYDDVVAIYGRETFDKLQTLKLFMVGAGALGCEFVKMLALTGVATAKPGHFTVTDDDNIEISNLNRQFLFRKPDVGKSKAERALAAGQRMNPHLISQSYKLRASGENESIFNDDFWEGLDIVINAVDNVHARLYVDSRCVFYGKPLLESGTLGTKCNSQIIIPHLTQSYGETSDPPEESIPLCTLKNFPYQIEHTIQWARDYFEGNFVEGPNECKKFIENPAEYLKRATFELRDKSAMLRHRLETIDKLSEAYKTGTYETCVYLARWMYEDVFHNMIAQLLYSFPLEHKTEAGQLFWSGPKRPPQILNYDPEDPMSLNFVIAAANIFAYSFGLDYVHDVSKIKALSKAVNLPKFELKKITIKEEGKEEPPVDKSDDDDEVIKRLVEKLKGFNFKGAHAMRATEFEKDDDSNHHIDFIAAVANLRARNYKIGEADRLKIKLIAGKIIPAIATTTAMVVGAVGLELLKIVLKKGVEVYKNSFMNLALPLWLFTEPSPPNKNKDKDYDPILLGPIKAIPSGFTVWDKITVKGPITVAGFIEHITKTYNVVVSIISAGKVSLYNKYSNTQAMKDRLNKNVKVLLEELMQKPCPSYKKYIELEVSGETLGDGIDATMPSIRYFE